MKSKLNILIFLCLFLIAIGSYFYFPGNKNVSQKISVTPTVVVTNTVSGASTSSSKCHVSWVDTSDPQAYLPDSNCTPGVIDPNVTQDNLSSTICVSGYTKTVRPSATYTNILKKQQMIDYGYTDTNMKDFEEDHLISLELGGDPSNPKNLWPEPHPSYNEKDKVENYLHSQVCSGAITLEKAQQEISTNWYAIYQQIK